MNAWLLGLVLAAAGTTEVSGAITVGGQLRQTQVGSLGALAHGRLDLARDFGRYFIEAHGSVLFSGSDTAVGLRDLGSSLTFGYRPAGFVQRFSLEFIPFNPSVRLPSFDWANAWGNAPLLEAPLVPMLTAQVQTTAGSLWLSARFKTLRNPLSQLTEIQPDFFLGLDVPSSSGLRFEARGAYLNNGLNQSLGSLGQKLPMSAGAAGARLSWTWNELVGPALDFTTYASDPLRFERFFATETHRTRFAAWIALEGGGGAQQLADPERFGSGKLQPMAWADLQVRVRLHELRLFGTARVQSFSFIAFDRMGIPPGAALSEASRPSPLLTGIVGADWAIRKLKLTPGLLLRLSQYATRTSPPSTGGNNPPPGDGATLIVGPNGYFATVRDVPPAPLLAVKASARWEVMSFASLVAELEVEKDFNDFRVGPMPAPQTDQITTTAQLFIQARF